MPEADSQGLCVSRLDVAMSDGSTPCPMKVATYNVKAYIRSLHIHAHSVLSDYF